MLHVDMLFAPLVLGMGLGGALTCFLLMIRYVFSPFVAGSIKEHFFTFLLFVLQICLMFYEIPLYLNYCNAITG